MNVAQNLLAQGDDDAPAILYGRECISYGQLRAAVGGVAAELLKSGLVKGDRVGLVSENSPFFVSVYLGVIRAGLCVVPLQHEHRDAVYQKIFCSTNMRRLYCSNRFAERFRPLAERAGVACMVEDPLAPATQAGPLDAPEIDPARDLAALMFTSGSTGEPKGVMVSHRNIDCNTRDICQYLELGADDRVMVVLPMSYCYGASLLHTHLRSGASLVLNNNFMFAEKVLDDMETKGCTGLAGVPSTYQILLRRTRFAARQFPALKWLQQAGGRLPVPYLKEIRAAHPDVKLFVMYGQTEATARLSYLPPEWLDAKLGSVGRGLPSTSLEVLRPDGSPVALGSNETGEVVAQGDNITLGYWNDPDETAKYFAHGKLYTGDIGRVDADGFLFLVERAREFIKSIGHRVSPAEIEEVIAELPEVVEVAVVAMPHDLFGEAIKAVVVVKDPKSTSEEAIRTHCLERLPNWKVPAAIEFVRALPKNSSGKVDRAGLRRD